jgi:hypothetical protein
LKGLPWTNALAYFTGENETQLISIRNFVQYYMRNVHVFIELFMDLLPLPLLLLLLILVACGINYLPNYVSAGSCSSYNLPLFRLVELDIMN